MQLKNKLIIAILVVLSIISVLSLVHTGLPITHDGQDHVARIANFYQNLVEGNLIPRWAANLNWGYGHPILEFLYPLPSYFASFFHLIGFSLVDSSKIVYGLGMILSLFFMFLWLKQFLGKEPALLGAFLYTYAPYRFVDLYVRGDIGENLAFAFVPLVLYFIFKLYKEPNLKYSLLGALSLALLVMAHNAIALITIPFIFLYGIYLIYISKNRKSLFVNLSALIIFGFALSAFFWVPALLEGKFTLRDIVTKGGYVSRFVNFKALIYGPWSYGGSGVFTQQLGIIQWLALLISPVLAFVFWLKKDKNYLLVLTCLLYTLLAIFLMLPLSNFLWARIMLLQNFQFPWRFLAITVFATAVLAALLIHAIPKKLQLIVVLILIALVLFVSKDYVKAKGYLYKPVSFYTGIYSGTTDTGESSPIWSVRFMEHFPKAHLEVLDGKATVKEIKRTSMEHQYTVTVAKRTLFEENTLYFPGWEIKANNAPVNVQFQDMQYRGTMLFFLEKGNYTVEAKYSETKLRLICDLISLVSLITLGGLFIFGFVKRRFS
ncbi:MAG: glycosyltransferase family 39 protein [Candidatus Levyibacteriota bacterium]